MYNSSFKPSDEALNVLKNGRILGSDENPAQMIERIVASLVSVEDRFGTSEREKTRLAIEFGQLLDQKQIVMSTPILTNAGRYNDKPLSACTVPPLDLLHDDFQHIKKVVTELHEEGMGTGFSLNGLNDPVRILKQLNEIAVMGSLSGKEDRPVGNMATLKVNDPHIINFINAKVGVDRRNEKWKFNISVDCGTDFFEKLENGGDIVMADGSSLSAKQIFGTIINAAHDCADPGLIFIDRMESDNPTPCVGHYLTTAPCAEVGLTKGESCQFGYINVAAFVTDGRIDISALRRTSRLMTRILDNALEISIENYSEDLNRTVMSRKRKIGIGICGLADLFIKCHLMYSSADARQMAMDIVALINFESKQASYDLAKDPGSFGAMSETLGNYHLNIPSFIERRYGNLESRYVRISEWIGLSEKIRTDKMLRNASTVALPPTGRSAIVIDASTGVEPVFSKDHYLKLHPTLTHEEVAYIQPAKNIDPMDHLRMVGVIQKAVDESISKTINLPPETTKENIAIIYRAAWELGLKGVSIYREGSKDNQPKQLI